jgi:hypothetical protein
MQCHSSIVFCGKAKPMVKGPEAAFGTIAAAGANWSRAQ